MMMTVHSQMSLKLIIFSLVVARGAQRIRQNSQSRLEGLIPVVEDWHAKGCFLGVSVYNKCSHLKYFVTSVYIELLILPLFIQHPTNTS